MNLNENQHNIKMEPFITTILLTATASLSLTVLSCLLFQTARKIRHERLHRRNTVKFRHYNTFINPPKPLYIPVTTEV